MSSTSKYIFDIGDAPVLTATFTEIDGTPATPDVVTVKVRDPAGIEMSYTTPHATINTSVVGKVVFSFPAALELAGEWTVRIRGVSGLRAAEEIGFVVRSSAFTAP